MQTCTQRDCMEICPFGRKLIMTQEISSNAVEPIVKQFSQLATAAQPKWLLPVRKAGLASVSELGVPTFHDEDWRFTNVAPIAQLPFQLAREAAVNGAESKALDEALFTKLPGNRLVFVNGFFSAKLSALKSVS